MPTNMNTIKALNIMILIILVIITSIVTVCAERIIASKSVTYSNQTSGLNSNNVHDAIDELYENCTNVKLFSKYLQSLAASSTVIKDDETSDHNMRYTGKNPNNYVTFAGEEWRVIGVFNNVSDGASKIETRVKIIKADTLGNMQWHSSTINVWKTATLNTALQKMYTSNNMIENALWHLGDLGGECKYTARASYDYERGTNVAKNNDPTWIGRIGLMYPSDYGYASSGCKDGTYNLKDYSNSTCTSTNWLFSYAEWLIVPNASNTTSARRVDSIGNVSSSSGDKRAVRPVVYLKSNVTCENCKDSTAGTKSNPYKIELSN